VLYILYRIPGCW